MQLNNADKVNVCKVMVRVRNIQVNGTGEVYTME